MKYRFQPRIDRLKQCRKQCNREAAQIQFIRSVVHAPEKIIDYTGNIKKRSRKEIIAATILTALSGLSYSVFHKDEDNAKIKTEQVEKPKTNLKNSINSIDDHLSNNELKKQIILKQMRLHLIFKASMLDTQKALASQKI